MARPLIAVCRGGYSGESTISHQSAKRMLAAVDRDRYEALFVSITRDDWECHNATEVAIPFDRATFGIDRGKGPERFAGALIAIHGTPGEDGPLQGYLDMLGIPYQTGGILNMSLTFSKYSTTALLHHLGFTVARSVMLLRDTPGTVEYVASVGYPCFVKPDRSGSSLGVTKVKSPGELSDALAAAFAECHVVIVEAAVNGIELTCGVLQLEGAIHALPVCEIRTSREFFDYEAKYHANDTQEIIPAPIPEEVTRLVQERSKAIYRALDCRGMVRVDHFWTGQDLVTIEVNTVPGFSGASIFPKMLEAAGMSVDEVINKHLVLMLEDRRQALAR